MYHRNIVEAIQKYKSSRNLLETNFIPDLHDNTQDNITPSNEDSEFKDCQEFYLDQDLETPNDELLEFINSQHHTDDQLDQVLQTYQAYSENHLTIKINAHFTYHVAQADQAKHASLIDRGANGGLAGSDVRVVTGIDNYELSGLNVVQCTALVNTYHGIVNLIKNEYAHYGHGCTIHSSGQIEWYTNLVDDKSVQVRGQQRIVTIDEYSMPLVCKGGLMYLELIGTPTDKNLENHPSVHFTNLHEWDPSVLDYEYATDNGEPSWNIDPNEQV